MLASLDWVCRPLLSSSFGAPRSRPPKSWSSSPTSSSTTSPTCWLLAWSASSWPWPSSWGTRSWGSGSFGNWRTSLELGSRKCSFSSYVDSLDHDLVICKNKLYPPIVPFKPKIWSFKIFYCLSITWITTLWWLLNITNSRHITQHFVYFVKLRTRLILQKCYQTAIVEKMTRYLILPTTQTIWKYAIWVRGYFKVN